MKDICFKIGFVVPCFIEKKKKKTIGFASLICLVRRTKENQTEESYSPSSKRIRTSVA